MRSLIMLFAIPLVGCSDIARSESGSDARPTGSRSFSIDQFTAVDDAGPDDVDVQIGPAFSIRAEGSAKTLDRLSIAKDGDTLKIRRTGGNSFSWGGDQGAKIYVTMPRITAASTSGSGDMTVSRITGDAFSAASTASGELTISNLAVRSATFSSTGSGGMTIAGTASSATLSVTASGDIDAKQFKTSSATVSSSGSGDIDAVVSGTATVNASASGDVTLTGGAKCLSSKSGSGDIDCS